MPDRDGHFLAQGIKYPKAFGLGNIFQIDAAKTGFQIFDGLDKFIRVFGVQTDGEGVNAAQVFEEHAFAFHDRDSRVRPDVA